MCFKFSFIGLLLQVSFICWRRKMQITRKKEAKDSNRTANVCFYSKWQWICSTSNCKWKKVIIKSSRKTRTLIEKIHWKKIKHKMQSKPKNIFYLLENWMQKAIYVPTYESITRTVKKKNVHTNSAKHTPHTFFYRKLCVFWNTQCETFHFHTGEYLCAYVLPFIVWYGDPI